MPYWAVTGRHSAVRAGQNRRPRPIRGPRKASRPPAVRSEGRWNHLSVDVNVFTNEGLFELTELPRRFVVIGGGVIGCEMAQAFAAFGSEVVVLDRADRLLSRLPEAASKLLDDAFEADGIRRVYGASVERFERRGDDHVVIATVNGEEGEFVGDAILASMGRVANMGGLGLEAAGVVAGQRGIEVDDFMNTANSRIYAVGDVASPHQFTHAADAMARIAVQNSLFFGRKRHSALVVPSCTFTSPEIATVGQTEASGEGLTAYRAEAADLDRTMLDGNPTGFIEVVADEKGVIVGGTVVGELINALSIAMTNGVSLSGLNNTIFAYPTESELLKRVGGAYSKTRLTPTVATLLTTLIRWRR